MNSTMHEIGTVALCDDNLVNPATDDIVAIALFIGVIISMVISGKAYYEQWAKLYRYAPPIYCFFISFIQGIFIFDYSTYEFIEDALIMTALGWLFWFCIWGEWKSEERKKKRYKNKSE